MTFFNLPESDGKINPRVQEGAGKRDPSFLHYGFNFRSQPSTSRETAKVEEIAYLDLRENILTSNDLKPKRKKRSKSERLRIRYKTRDKLVKLLREVGEDRTAESVALCGQRFEVWRCRDHLAVKTPYHRCNVRYCPMCASRRSSKYKKKYLPFALEFVKRSPVKLTPCLLTLTQVKIKGERLVDSRERILKSFRRFIRHGFFEDYFEGGLFTVENTISDEGNHTHLHVCVFRKKFVDEKLLKQQWAMVSPGAVVLNIKRIDDLEKGLAECIKYVSKPVNVDKFERRHLLELLEVKGKRMIDTFGKFRRFCQKYRLPESEKPERPRFTEDQCCVRCNEKLFRVTMTGKELIAFYQRVEALPLLE